MKNQLESGDYKRIGALKDVEIICKFNSNNDSSSDSSFLSQSLFIFLILMLI